MAIVQQPQPAAQPASGFTYGMLTEKHSEWDGELWEKLDLLHEGGWRILQHASKFITKAPDEPDKFYKWRTQNTSYINYFARLVGYLTGGLFNETLVVGPSADDDGNPKPLPDEEFYKAFALDCDRRGTDFSQFVRSELLTRALVFRRALVQVDLPIAKTREDGTPPATLGEEDALGNRRAYVVPLDIESMFNWEKDDEGNFKWCVLHRIHRDRSRPFASSGKYQHEFKVWARSEAGVEWFILRTDPVKDDNELTPESLLSVVDRGSTSFDQIPILELEMPKALWVGNQAGPLCQEHFQGRSDLKGSIQRNLVEIPYVKRGAEIPPVHGGFSETQADPNRGADPVRQVRQKGWVAIGSEDELGFAGPSGVAHTIARDELKSIREEIFASVNAMALQLENSAAALSRSGDSKSEDKSALETLLTFMGHQVREIAQKLMARVAAARGEADKVEWVASGLSTFDQEDRGELVAEAAVVEPLRIPSPTWARLYRTKVALATVPDATAEEKRLIKDEIQQHTSDEEVTTDPIEKARQMAEAQGKRDAERGAGKGPPGKGAPPGKPAAKGA